MRYFITGAAGFIGSHLTEALLDAGHEVTGLDDLSTGRLANLAAVTPHPRLRLVLGSVVDSDLVEDLCAGADRVFHLAAGPFPAGSQALESLRTGIHGTQSVAGAAQRAGARVVVVSSGEIYGKNAKAGLREDDDRVLGSPLMSRWSRAQGEAAAESVTQDHVRELGLWAVIVRLFDTAGPRQAGRDGAVLPRFVRQGLAGEPLTVSGTGDQVRCFCHVGDVIPALIALAEAEPARGRAVNLGGCEQVSICGLAQRVIAATGSRSVIVHCRGPEACEDVPRRVPDCTLARDLVGFRPVRTLDNIIGSLIEDQRGARAATR